jgi:hypothetical protein
MIASAVTARSFAIILGALLGATQISIFAYSATPNAFMFKTILSTNHKKSHNRDVSINHAVELELLVPQSDTTHDDATTAITPAVHPSTRNTTSAIRSSLFRRRSLEETTGRLSSSDDNDSVIGTLPAMRGGMLASLSSPFHLVRGSAVIGKNLLVAAFLRFANFVGQTKARCFLLLLFSVLIESYATTLSKQAKDTGNAFLFIRACFVYLMWYVSLRKSLARYTPFLISYRHCVSLLPIVWSASISALRNLTFR